MRITYKCPREQRSKPLALRTQWDVYRGEQCIATIDTKNEPSSERSHSLRIWNARLRGNVFDPFDFPHVDDEPESANHPFVIVEGSDTVLVNPQPMTMKEARSWIRQVALRGSDD